MLEDKIKTGNYKSFVHVPNMAAMRQHENQEQTNRASPRY